MLWRSTPQWRWRSERRIMEVIPAFHTGQRVRRRLTQYVNAAPTPPGYHVSASEHAGNRLCGNSKWDWIFTSLSHYNPLLCEGDHMCQVLLRWASDDGCRRMIRLGASSHESACMRPRCDGRLLLIRNDINIRILPRRQSSPPFGDSAALFQWRKG